MKKILLIITSVLSISLLALCAVLYISYDKKDKLLQEENTSLSSDMDNLQKDLQDKEDYIAGQKDYISELTEQLTQLQNLSSSDENMDDADRQDNHASSGYEEEYPDLYAGVTYSDQKQSSKKVYLTFDDGPSDLTPQVLDLLDKYDAKATFFVVYTENEEYTSYLKEIVNRGHTLALHSYSHDYNKIYRSVEAFLEDFEKVYNWVYEETGQRATLFRFPGGSTNGRSYIVKNIIAEMERRGFIYYDWNVSSGDGSNLTTTENILNNVCSTVGNHSLPVVLMHDGVGKEATLQALPSILETLADQGYEFDLLTPAIEPIQYRK